VTPAAYVDKPHRRRLHAGELRQRWHQPGLDIGDRVVPAPRKKRLLTATALRLADAKQVRNRMGHVEHPLPVLPSMRHSLADSIGDLVATHGTRQSAKQQRADPHSELLEIDVGRHLQPVEPTKPSIALHTGEDSPTDGSAAGSGDRLVMRLGLETLINTWVKTDQQRNGRPGLVSQRFPGDHSIESTTASMCATSATTLAGGDVSTIASAMRNPSSSMPSSEG